MQHRACLVLHLPHIQTLVALVARVRRMFQRETTMIIAIIIATIISVFNGDSRRGLPDRTGTQRT